jgi:hypothetical protein
MNAAGYLIALLLGFIGGVAGALVTVEVKTEQARKETSDLIAGLEYVRGKIKDLRDTDNALALAIQTLTQKVKTDRGAIWESLNGLWSDYDRRQKAETKTDPEEPEKKERKKTKNEKRSGTAGVH